MKSNYPGTGSPPPEDLVAYMDGELAEAARARMEAWLASHPEAAAEMAEQRRLAQLWREAWPLPPAESTWILAFRKVEIGVAASRRRRLASFLFGLTTVAAGVLLALALTRREWLPSDPGSTAAEPFPITTVDDVEIVRIQNIDPEALLVGEPPVAGELDMAAHGDVIIRGVQPDADNVVPAMYTRPDPATSPMIIYPVSEEAREENGPL
jgi:hypothetical protein